VPQRLISLLKEHPSEPGQLTAEDLLHQLLETAPDGIVVVDQDGNMVLVNAQTERMFGFRKEELLEQKIEILVPERFRGRHPGHRGSFFQQPQARSMGQSLELFARRKDGSEFPVEISLSPLKTDYGTLVSSAIRDISDRKRGPETRGPAISPASRSRSGRHGGREPGGRHGPGQRPGGEAVRLPQG
jgi:PAS domain S-box-containing protein